tara:strand:+ start:1487 stop:2191 length:705 start_codon:yes stop_codon:yes gene_type:complete
MSISFLSADTSGTGSGFLTATSTSSGSNEEDQLKISELQFNLGQYDALNRQIINNIKNLLLLNTQGKYDDLTELFSEEFYNSLSTLLIRKGTFQNISPDFEYNSNIFKVYKETFHRVLEGLRKSIQLNTRLEDTKIELNHAINRAEILDDMSKLKQYLEEKQNALYFADIKTQLTEMAVLKPQYQRYIETYGFPEGMIFESEKMAKIIVQLIQENVITEADVFGDYNPNIGFVE